MNKEEILNKYIDLIDKGYCSGCNELNCIDNFPHAKITHAIRELQQENQELKLELSGYRQAILEDKDMLGLKEKNQELKEELVSANESITWWNNRFNAVTRDNEQLKNKIKELVKYGCGTDMSLGEFKEFYKLGTGKDYDPKKCPEVE